MKTQPNVIKALFSNFCLVLFFAIATLGISGCDNQRIAELEEGVATEGEEQLGAQ